jgi:hypothetical protein
MRGWEGHSIINESGLIGADLHAVTIVRDALEGRRREF